IIVGLLSALLCIGLCWENGMVVKESQAAVVIKNEGVIRVVVFEEWIVAPALQVIEQKPSESSSSIPLESERKDMVQTKVVLNECRKVQVQYDGVKTNKWYQSKHIELVNIIGNSRAGMLTRAMAKELSAASTHECLFVDFLFEEEPKKVSKGLEHPRWVNAMQEELNQFSKNKVWTLVLVPYGKTIIGSKWVFKNKRDETRIVIKNKARFLAQGYNQQEGIDYDETFSHVTRLEAIRIFLAFATYMNFIVYQIDVKSAFLMAKIRRIFLDGLAYWMLESDFFIFLRLNSKMLTLFDIITSAEAEYVAAAGCYANILWMKNHILKGDIELHFIPTQYQLADIFTKPLDEPTFKRLIVKLGMLNIDSKPEASVLTEEN
ncbi:retrovirus-related pol polyprotein from transposon TNT 1-94, partial [Tanacetum coccineum]